MKKYRHNWSEEDDIVALYYYLYKGDGINKSKHQIGELLGMGYNSFHARIGNFDAIHSNGNFNHVAKLSFEVYKQYSVLCKQDLQRKVLEILAII
jgi:hypothetical protein